MKLCNYVVHIKGVSKNLGCFVWIWLTFLYSGHISRSKSELIVFGQYTTNSTYFVYNERRKNNHCHVLRLPCKFCENRLRTHTVMMAYGYLPLNDDFVVFSCSTTNSANLYTLQRREKVEKRILKIFWKFNEGSRVYDGVMALAVLAFSVFHCKKEKQSLWRTTPALKIIQSGSLSL